MKKAILILVLGLLWCNVGVAESKLPACEGTILKKWTDCYGTQDMSDGAKYTGEWKKGKQHGQGTLTYANGNKHVGEWKKDKELGKGKDIFATGQQLLEQGYRVMDEPEMKTYIFNRTIYTRVRKANGKVGKNTYPSYFHESGRRFVRVNNKIHDTPWKFNDGVMGVESIKDGKWVYSLWYKKGDSVVGCSSKKEEPCGKYDQSESRDGDSEGYLN